MKTFPFIYSKYKNYAHSYIIQLLVTHSHSKIKSKINTHRPILPSYHYIRICHCAKEHTWACSNMTHWYILAGKLHHLYTEVGNTTLSYILKDEKADSFHRQVRIYLYIGSDPPCTTIITPKKWLVCLESVRHINSTWIVNTHEHGVILFNINTKTNVPNTFFVLYYWHTSTRELQTDSYWHTVYNDNLFWCMEL